MGKRILTGIGLVLAVVILAAAGGLLYLTVTEYRPEEVQPADRILTGAVPDTDAATLTLTTWNLGYGGLGEESDFFMDGGKMVDPPSPETVEKNLAGIREYLLSEPSDIWLLQEVDVDSARSGGVDQFAWLTEILPGSAAFAYNYKCPFVPIPLPPIGRVEGGLATVGSLKPVGQAQRVSLPCLYSWPMRTANIKRCLLVTRWALPDTDRELVVINLHLEAYESGEGRIAQTKQLLELMQREYEQGNYVIAGGDFNQSFPGTRETYPIQDPEKWAPGLLSEDSLPEHWQYAFDATAATCRLLDRPYSPDIQKFIIDGFLLSPNVTLEEIKTVDLDFAFSDHNPVRLTLSLDAL